MKAEITNALADWQDQCNPKADFFRTLGKNRHFVNFNQFFSVVVRHDNNTGHLTFSVTMGQQTIMHGAVEYESYPTYDTTQVVELVCAVTGENCLVEWSPFGCYYRWIWEGFLEWIGGQAMDAPSPKSVHHSDLFINLGSLMVA